MEVTIKRVCCQSCGADLEIPDGVRFLNCNYCNSKLEVVEHNSITHTRLLESVARDTRQMAGNLRVIELQNDLERLDREWDHLKEHYVVQDKHGHRSMPSKSGSVIGGIIGIGGGTLFLFATLNSHAPAFVPLFGLVFIAAGIFALVQGTKKADEYQFDAARYQSARQRLIREIESARQRN